MSAQTARLPVTKTPKVYIGGAFVRSESARTFKIMGADGTFYANIPQCTRKDLRNAVEAAAKAGPGWAKRTAYNRAQILYRLAEMLEARSAELVGALVRFGARPPDAQQGTTTCIERLIHYAGWADKYEQLLGSVNPVATRHFNFTVTEPMGVVGIIAPDSPPLLGLISMLAPVIASGNSVAALASERFPRSGHPSGGDAGDERPAGRQAVVTLDRYRREPVPHLRDPRAPARAFTPASRARTARLSASAPPQRQAGALAGERGAQWNAPVAQGLELIRAFVELTIRHPIAS